MTAVRDRPRAAFVAAIFVLGATALGVIYGVRLNYPPVRSDGVGYYLYLPAAFIDHDLTLKRTITRTFHGRMPEEFGVRALPDRSGAFIKYPAGEAVLLFPFFLAADLVTALLNWPTGDGFAPVFEAAIAIGGLVYFVAGVALLLRLLERTCSRAVAIWTTAFMVFGTNLFHYGTYDNAFSHVYSFFAFTCLFHAIDRWYAQPSAASATALGTAAGLVTLIRPTNSVVFVFVVLTGVVDRATWAERLRFFRRHLPLLGLGAAIYLTVISIQLAYWRDVTGHWLIFSYPGETFDFGHPRVLDVLFSIRKGLFFWSPLLLAAVAGFWAMRRVAPAYLLPTLIFMPLNAWVIASWHDWAYGGSFGHRAFVESVPIFALGFASLLEAARARGYGRACLGVAMALTLMSLDLMIKYWVGLIPYDHTTWPQFVSGLTAWL